MFINQNNKLLFKGPWCNLDRTLGLGPGNGGSNPSGLIVIFILDNNLEFYV